MKLPKVMVHIRLGKRIFDHMQTIQLYKSKTATAIIEDALEKGLAWYLKQAQSELGYTKEKPLTWEQLAELVKLSVSPKEDDTTSENKEPSSNVSDEELDNTLNELFTDEQYKKTLKDYYEWKKDKIDAKNKRP